MTTELPRDIRNCNPGNIRKNPANKWQGLAPVQADPDFCTFQDLPYGIRAMARLLINYQDKKEALTVTALISSWAPSSENNTREYINRVCSYMTKKLGFNVDAITKIDTHDHDQLRALIEAIILVESAVQWDTYITEAQMEKGLRLAGVEGEKKPLSQSKIITGQQIATAGIGLSAIPDIVKNVSDVQDKLQPLIDYSEYIKYAFLACAIIGIGLTVWARIQQRKKGID